MLIALIFLLLSPQIPAVPSEAGVIEGILRDSVGKPVAGVRVTAMVPPSPDITVGAGTAMASIAETDEAGRYRLERVPPGRYSIAAGRASATSGIPISITLAAAPTQSVPGFRVTGTSFGANDEIYLSGSPGLLFHDGTFEFRGVPAGLHTIVKYSEATVTASTIFVSDRDVDNVRLRAVQILPSDILRRTEDTQRIDRHSRFICIHPRPGRR